MSKLALGIIETVGLAAAIEAADVAVKSANIKIVGYELTKGDGMATVKFEGDIGAVKAAIHAATIAANKVNKVYGKHIIPRQSSGLKMLVYSKETIGLEKKNELEKIKEIEVLETKKDVFIKDEDEKKVVKDLEEEKEPIKIYENNSLEEDKDSEEEICNICKDYKCPRRKGAPRKMCIHYKDLKKRRES